MWNTLDKNTKLLYLLFELLYIILLKCMVNILILSEKHKEEITRHVYTANEAQRDRDRENEEKDL